MFHLLTVLGKNENPRFVSAVAVDKAHLQEAEICP